MALVKHYKGLKYYVEDGIIFVSTKSLGLSSDFVKKNMPFNEWHIKYVPLEVGKTYKLMVVSLTSLLLAYEHIEKLQDRVDLDLVSDLQDHVKGRDRDNDLEKKEEDISERKLPLEDLKGAEHVLLTLFIPSAEKHGDKELLVYYTESLKSVQYDIRHYDEYLAR